MHRNGIGQQAERGGFVALLPALAVAFLTATSAMVTLYAPPATGQVGVVFAPWVSESQALGAVIAAGGTLANSSRFSNVLVAVAPDEGFHTRIRALGALFTISALGLCGPAVGQEGEIS